MHKIPLVWATALMLAAGCMPAPDREMAGHSEQALAKAAAAPVGMGFIESVDYVGTGCDGDASSAFSPDKQVVTSIFSSFVAAVAPGEDPEAAARNCLLMLRVNVPRGWSYSLESVDHRGFAGLDEGVTASRRAVYVISGSPVHATPAASFEGELLDSYNDADVSPEAPGPWSRCGQGQDLFIAVETEVDSGGDAELSGQLTVDTIDTELRWRRCD